MPKEKLCPCCGAHGDASHDPSCALTAYMRGVVRVEISPDHVVHMVDNVPPEAVVQDLVAATKSELVAAFAAWENEYRATPDGFYTAEEIAALEVADVSERRAICLQAYLRQVKTTN